MKVNVHVSTEYKYDIDELGEGYSPRLEGKTTKYGTYTGEYFLEDDVIWWRMIDNSGNVFCTDEEYVEVIDLT